MRHPTGVYSSAWRPLPELCLRTWINLYFINIWRLRPIASHSTTCHSVTLKIGFGSASSSSLSVALMNLHWSSVIEQYLSSFLRFYTMSIMMAVDLLGCTGSTEERAALLHKTIQLAAELKSTLGNMFGFAAVMRALELPQVNKTHISINHQISSSSWNCSVQVSWNHGAILQTKLCFNQG